jgi:hypothetical protein
MWEYQTAPLPSPPVEPLGEAPPSNHHGWPPPVDGATPGPAIDGRRQLDGCLGVWYLLMEAEAWWIPMVRR